MALKLQTANLYAILQGTDPDWPNGLDANLTHQAYTGLDSGVTLRVWERLDETLRARNTPHARSSYAFVRAMQAPAFDMMRRGIAINQKVRQDETERYTAIRLEAQALLDRLADAVWGPERYLETQRIERIVAPLGKKGLPLKPRRVIERTTVERTRPRGLNANSNTQLLAFFNVALGLPVEYEIRKTPAGNIRTPSANDKALKKWGAKMLKGPAISNRDRSVPYVNLAAPFVTLILAIRDADKTLSVLRTPLDPDGRMRCSYNVVGTESGRWSSSKNVHGRGSNLQNITPTMRRMFCADDGYRMVSTDLEQAESYVTAGLVWQSTGDRAYWDAILSGDLHTQVCRMAWPELPWTGDFKHDRKIADSPSHDVADFSYRDVAKRVGHGSNYMGSAFGIAAAVGLPPRTVEDFQARYYRAFPAILDWHGAVKTSLRDDPVLVTPLGRERQFFSRPWDDRTIREAVAFGPQSTVAELLNLVMYHCWRRSLLPKDHPDFLPIQLLLQNHDAFLFQTPNATPSPTHRRG